jgi:hypothetical protein
VLLVVVCGLEPRLCSLIRCHQAEESDRRSSYPVIAKLQQSLIMNDPQFSPSDQLSSKRSDDLVSTIIPVFNRPDLLTQAVDSVLGQKHRPIEIIIIDDGSTDNTPDVCASNTPI